MPVPLRRSATPFRCSVLLLCSAVLPLRRFASPFRCAVPLRRYASPLRCGSALRFSVAAFRCAVPLRRSAALFYCAVQLRFFFGGKIRCSVPLCRFNAPFRYAVLLRRSAVPFVNRYILRRYSKDINTRQYTTDSRQQSADITLSTVARTADNKRAFPTGSMTLTHMSERTPNTYSYVC